MALTLHHEFQQDQNLTGIKGATFTCTRSGATATRRNSSGVIETVSANTARHDHDWSGNALGVLVEGSRENLILNSADFSTTWTVTGASVTVNQSQGKDGTTTADAFIGNSGTSAMYLEQGSLSHSGGLQCFSVFIEPGDARWMHLRITDIAVVDADVWFDTQTQSVGTQDVSISDAGIEDVGGGVYWLYATHNFAASGADRVRIYPANADNDNNYTGDGSTVNFYAWGAQFEAGAFPSSYIPTTSTTVTRNADDINTTDLSWCDARQGIYFVKGLLLPGTGLVTESARVIEANHTTPDVDRFLIYTNTASGFWDAGAIQEGNNTSTAVVNTSENNEEADPISIAVGYDSSNGIYLKQKDKTAQSDATITVPDNSSDFNTFNLGSRYNETLHLYGWIQALRYYDSWGGDTSVIDNMADSEIFPGGKPPGLGLSFGKMGRLGY